MNAPDHIDFHNFIQASFASLAPQDQTAIEELISSLAADPNDDIDDLIDKLSGFLLVHESINSQIQAFTQDSTRVPDKFNRQKIDPKKYADVLRNAVLIAQQPPSTSPDAP